jgi:hypothetical protein
MLRSPLLGDPSAIFSAEKWPEGRKEQKTATFEKEKPLDGADIVRDGRFSGDPHWPDLSDP